MQSVGWFVGNNSCTLLTYISRELDAATEICSVLFAGVNALTRHFVRVTR